MVIYADGTKCAPIVTDAQTLQLSVGALESEEAVVFPVIPYFNNSLGSLLPCDKPFTVPTEV